MKKIFVAVAVVALFASCTKDYTCSFSDPAISDIQYEGLDKDEADAAETGCTLVGGTWSAD